jgi:hypothetical protein
VILIWRGWGLLAIVALFPLLASCAGLITVEPIWIFMLAASLSLLLAGVVCVYCGARWNRTGVEHVLEPSGPWERPFAFGADWELRLGPDNRFRVFYQVKAESREVRILAVGVKDRSRLFIGGEEFEE